MYEFQVKVLEDKKKVWKSVRPTHGTPYQYETKQEAQDMMDMCYPDTIDKRVIKID